jgi:hypothetical protein
MRSIATLLILSIAIVPATASAQRAHRGGFGGGARGGAPASRGGANQGRGFNLGNDVPSTRQGGGAHVNDRNNNVNVNNRNNNVNVNNHNNYNRNVNVNNVNVNRNYSYTYNRSGYNGYGWHGAVVVNPVYRGPAWGWNRGVVWAPNYGYWGGGFWGAFAVGAATAAVMGSIYYNNQRYNSYQVSAGSPGAQLLSNYGLQQVPCGPPGLVVIYGPNSGVICANPNSRVAAGTYAVNENNLTLQSQ